MTKNQNHQYLEQNTTAWHEHRAKYVNASEVGAIMGLNPYETRSKLMEIKISHLITEENDAMRHGKNTEPVARQWFCENQYKNFLPVVFTKGFMSASLDGWHEDSKTLVEIKCPSSLRSKAWQDFMGQKSIIPMYYYAQIQAQIYCSEAEKAYFLVYVNANHKKVVEVPRNEAFIESMLKQCEVFFEEMHCTVEAETKIEEEDSKTEIEAYLRALEQSNQAKKNLDEVKKALMAKVNPKTMKTNFGNKIVAQIIFSNRLNTQKLMEDRGITEIDCIPYLEQSKSVRFVVSKTEEQKDSNDGENHA